MSSDERLQQLRARLLHDFRKNLNIDNTDYFYFNHINTKAGTVKSIPFKLFAILNLDENYQHGGMIIEELGEEYTQVPTELEKFLQGNPSKVYIESKSPADKESFNNQSLRFTGTVYLYCNRLTEPEQVVRTYFQQKGMKLVIRDEAYWQKHIATIDPDAFICHDSRDKPYVELLYVALVKRQAKIWFDKYSLTVGDSLSQKIDEGLRTCHHAILIVSKNLLSNKSWARAEFEALQTRQILSGEKRILLPIWLDVSAEEVKQFSAWLADKFALDGAENIAQIADKLVKVFNEEDVSKPPA
jgi:WD40 repeat protein